MHYYCEEFKRYGSADADFQQALSTKVDLEVKILFVEGVR